MVNLSDRRYTYFHDPFEAIDIHHLILQKGSSLLTFLFLSSLLPIAFCLFIPKDSLSTVWWSFPLSGFFVIVLLFNPVKKESVVILPAFGVQLETHYLSGRSVKRFVPVDKILKPLLSECVTPVTCYWSLSLLIREEEQLMLVFKELHPPVKMLVPIWKALCAATDYDGGTEIVAEEY